MRAAVSGAEFTAAVHGWKRNSVYFRAIGLKKPGSWQSQALLSRFCKITVGVIYSVSAPCTSLRSRLATASLLSVVHIPFSVHMWRLT